MRAFRVTYANGDAYITSANGTLEEFTAYATQNYHTEENQVTGKETKLYVATVEEVTTEKEPETKAKEVSSVETDTDKRTVYEIDRLENGTEGTEVWIERESKLEEPEYFYRLFQFKGEE